MNPVLRELAVFLIFVPAAPFYIWQWRTIVRKYPKTDRSES